MANSDDLARTLYVNGITYELDTSRGMTKRHKMDDADKTRDRYRYTHLVEIQDKDGIPLVSARIYASWEETEEFAEDWIYQLLRVNPLKGMKYTIRQHTNMSDR